jgi:hypothetical protein
VHRICYVCMLRLKMAVNHKGKTVSFNTMKAFKASRGIAPFILHLGTNKAGWALGPLWIFLRGQKSLASASIRIPDHPAPTIVTVMILLLPKHVAILSAYSVQKDICVGTKGTTTLTLRKVLENRGGWRLMLRRM